MAELTLTVAEAAEAIGVSKTTMYSLVHSKGFPRVTFGTTIKIPKTSLQQWLENKAEEEAMS